MPERAVVSNTSPLLYLHQVGQLALLQRLYRSVLVPQAVARELTVGRRQGIDTPDLARLPWIEIRSVERPRLVPAIVDLGAGEAEVIALGLELQPSLLIIDDRLGRRISALLALPFTGTLGVLIKAKQAGHLQRVAAVLEALKRTTMWLHPELIEKALAEAGEL